MAKNAAALTAAFCKRNRSESKRCCRQSIRKRIRCHEQQIHRSRHGICMPNAEIGMMDAKSAAKIMYEGSDAATINEKAAEYATLQNNVTSAARRGYVDTIIEPEDTRKYVIGAFEMLYTKREDRPDRKHGTV